MNKNKETSINNEEYHLPSINLLEESSFKEIINSDNFKENEKFLFPLAIGKENDKTYITGLENSVPLIIVGTDNTEIKGCIDTIILSILYKSNPNDVKFALIDTKNELSVYKNLPHIYNYCSATDAFNSLKKLLNLCWTRYEKYARNRVKNIEEYNDITISEDNKDYYIVVIINDLADLKSSVEKIIVKLAEIGKDVGIFLTIATQKPTQNVITNDIAWAFFERISFKVNSKEDSNAILDFEGAEKLLGNGDMIVYPYKKRLQCIFVSSKEIESVIDFINSQNFQKEDNDDMDVIMQEIEETGINNKKLSNSDKSIITIQEIVAQEYNITVKNLKSKKLKTTEVVLPRQIAMYLAKTIVDISTTDIGNAFGGRDHITVMHAYNKIKGKMKNDPFFNVNINKIAKKIKNVLGLGNMKCKFCDSENTKDISITYVGDEECIERYTTAECNDCKKTFGYVSKVTVPEIISSKYTIPKEEE